MRDATVRDLRNRFAKLEAWLAAGETVRIVKRGEPIAILTAISHRLTKPLKRPDFAARRRAIWKGRVFSVAEVTDMRADEAEGEP